MDDWLLFIPSPTILAAAICSTLLYLAAFGLIFDRRFWRIIRDFSVGVLGFIVAGLSLVHRRIGMLIIDWYSLSSSASTVSRQLLLNSAYASSTMRVILRAENRTRSEHSVPSELHQWFRRIERDLESNRDELELLAKVFDGNPDRRVEALVHLMISTNRRLHVPCARIGVRDPDADVQLRVSLQLSADVNRHVLESLVISRAKMGDVASRELSDIINSKSLAMCAKD